jgi:hypothetical protein
MRIVLRMSSDPASVILPGNLLFWHNKAVIDWSSFVLCRLESCWRTIETTMAVALLRATDQPGWRSL